MNQGQEAEGFAKDYLINQGLTWIASNVSYPCGELDIVMKDSETLVFVEVKFRSSKTFGGALNAVTSKKIARLRRAATQYLQTHKLFAPCRFDLVAIDGNQVQWLKNIC